MTVTDSDVIGAIADIGDQRPTCWLVVDVASGASDMRAAADAAGLRVVRQASASEAIALLDDGRPSSIFIVDVGDAISDAQLRLLDILDMQATDAFTGTVVSCTPASLDAVAARISAPYATLICNPLLTDRIAALELAKVAAVGVRDAPSLEAIRLQHLTDEVSRIARALATLSGNDVAPPVDAVSDGLIGYRAGPSLAPSPKPVVVRADDIRNIVRLRRRRDRLFAGDLFADPAWDMMLDLMIARIERLRVAVSSLCIAAAVPATTALRWIKTLTETGIFVRVDDPTDRRRVFIELSDDAAKAVLDLLGEAKQSGAALV